MEHELSGRYPIILGGNEAGAVTVSREGLFWRFDASCTMQEELMRLSVYGNGVEGYLGVMEPADGELHLTKKLSRSAVSAFPAAISYATRSGEAPPEAQCAHEDEEKAPPSCDAPTEAAVETEVDCGCELPAEDDKPPPEAAAVFSSEEPWRHCPCPCSLFSGMGAKAVCAQISGALTKSSDDGLFLAVPEEVALSLPENEILKFSAVESIAGKRYLLAEIKE